MGSIILCHSKKAREPYEIARIKRRIYTLEELCYYLCNHLFLIDHTIMNEQLCDWIKVELELPDLAAMLQKHLKENGSKEHFIMIILNYSAIYSAAELKQMQNVLDKFKNQKPVEKQKYKADNLLEGDSVKAAIAIYQKLLHEEKDESMDRKFYGRIYGCLGAAYGRMFLYEEAAKMYEAAFQICEEESMLKAFIYACKMYMTKAEYKELLQKSSVYQGIDEVLYNEVETLKGEVHVLSPDETLDKWKDQYRRFSAGEN